MRKRISLSARSSVIRTRKYQINEDSEINFYNLSFQLIKLCGLIDISFKYPFRCCAMIDLPFAEKRLVTLSLANGPIKPSLDDKKHPVISSLTEKLSHFEFFSEDDSHFSHSYIRFPALELFPLIEHLESALKETEEMKMSRVYAAQRLFRQYEEKQIQDEEKAMAWSTKLEHDS